LVGPIALGPVVRQYNIEEEVSHPDVARKKKKKREKAKKERVTWVPQFPLRVHSLWSKASMRPTS
jgi:hypothetical protein